MAISLFAFCKLEFKEVLCVMVADTGDDFAKGFVVCRVFTLIHPAADEVTHNTAEIFMARIGHEAAGVCQHTHKSAEKTQVCQGAHLLNHTVALVIEPPAGAELNFRRGFCALEVAEHVVILLCRKNNQKQRKTLHFCLGKLGKGFFDIGVGGDIVVHFPVIKFAVGHHVKVAGAGKAEYNCFFFARFAAL